MATEGTLMTTMTDEISARGLGVDLRSCQRCESRLRMNDLHRIHIVRLTRQVTEEQERLRPAQEALAKLHARFQRMRLICLAGWFLAFMLATGDVLNWGRG